MNTPRWLIWLALIVLCHRIAFAAERWAVWRDGKPECQLIVPRNNERAARLCESTITDFLKEFYGVQLPIAWDINSGGSYLVVGSPENNPELAALTKTGASLTSEALGDEGFQLLTHSKKETRYIIVYGKTPRALKHACQELILFRLRANTNEAWLDAPLNVVMRPAIAYRGVYMLPCWSAYDSFESWQRVLRFNSELTLNRNWFWLDGFPVAGHTGEYAKSDLADAANVQRLIDLANAEEMKVYIGGGWFNWHHEKAVGKDYAKGREYYLAYLRAFTNFHGFYIEPTGEGSEIKDWRPEAETLRELIRIVHRERPEFEFALAIGKFNNAEYLKMMSGLDPARVFWWWCWGDPIRDKALDLFPSVVRWHISQKMADYHGSLEPPRPEERILTGIATSYDPGQGFGNPWNGWGKLGVNQPRNFHPHTIPYFAHQYFFRERCWNLNLAEGEFVARLHQRLFDADAPTDAGPHYWRISQLAYDAVRKEFASAEEMASLRQFVSDLRKRNWTAKMTDTVARMEETLRQLP